MQVIPCASRVLVLVAHSAYIIQGFSGLLSLGACSGSLDVRYILGFRKDDNEEGEIGIMCGKEVINILLVSVFLPSLSPWRQVLRELCDNSILIAHLMRDTFALLKRSYSVLSYHSPLSTPHSSLGDPVK